MFKKNEQSSQDKQEQEESEQSSQDKKEQEESEQSSQDKKEQQESEQLESDKSSQNQIKKLNINIIKALTDLFGNPIKLYVNSTKKYNDLNNHIFGINQFKNKPSLKHYQIKYYETQVSEIEITDSNQKVGSMWVYIKIADDDPNWEGETTQRIKIDFIKTNLNTINNLKDNNSRNLTITADVTKTFNDLTSIIINFQKFVSISLTQNYEIVYESYNKAWIWSSYSTIEKTAKQFKGRVYVTISASVNDPNWEGKAERIEIELT